MESERETESKKTENRRVTRGEDKKRKRNDIVKRKRETRKEENNENIFSTPMSKCRPIMTTADEADAGHW